MNLDFDPLLSILYITYLLIGVLIAFIMFPRHSRRQNYFVIITTVILGTLIPLFGPLIAIVYAIYFRIVEHKITLPATQTVLIPEYIGELPLEFSGAAMGSISARLRFSINDSERIRAVSQITGAHHNEQYRLLSRALSDPAEEVRLLAYSALDLREHKNTMLLIDLENRLVGNSNPAVRQTLLEHQAWIMWNIAHQQVQDVRQSKRTGPPSDDSFVESHDLPENSSASMTFLQGLDTLEQGKLQLAAKLFLLAQEKGVPEVVIAPYLAATRYRQGNLAEVSTLLNRLGALRLSPRYGACARLWQDAQK
ncbi:MAG: hypothetical protein ACYCQM_12995 [Acidithiobacillus sp.]